jgi:Ni,Fe-hydrogenase maturation factor
MKPKLVIGLGNDAMGDDGVGGHVAAALFGDGRLPDDTEVRWGRMNLEVRDHDLRDRNRILVIQAQFDDLEPGAVSVVAGEGPEARITFISVSIDGEAMTPELSVELNREIPAIVDRVLDELS